MNEHDVSTLLAAATADIEVPSAPARALVQAGHRRRHRHRARTISVGAVTAVAVAIGIPVASERIGPSAPSSRSTTPAAQGCAAQVAPALLPSWARDGFSEARPKASYVASRRGDILAILFAQPLTAPPADDHNNKILWVSRPPLVATPTHPGTTVADPGLHIEARLEGTATVITRVVPGGPGPSIVDLPQPGCWHLTLRWGGRTDHIELAYLPPR